MAAKLELKPPSQRRKPPRGWTAPEIMTIAETAWYMRRSREWVIRKCRAGQLASSQDVACGVRTIKKKDADAYMDERRTAPAADAPVVSPPRRRRRRATSAR
jgi:hypothetical protein